MVKTNALKGRQCRFIYVDGTRSSASDDNPNRFLKYALRFTHITRYHRVLASTL